MTRINVKDMKQVIKDINGIDPFNDVMSFFYDESGNCRKFLLTPNGVNSEDSLKGDFVLAGVAFDGKKKEIDITGLHSALEYICLAKSKITAPQKTSAVLSFHFRFYVFE